MTKPTLQCLLQMIPQDGTGRLGGGMDQTLRSTATNGAVFVTHGPMLKLFGPEQLDRFLTTEFGGYWRPDRDVREACRVAIMEAVEYCFAFTENIIGGSPAGSISIVPNVEPEDTGWVKRDRGPIPYGAEVPYASKTRSMMRMLCDMLDTHGALRWPGVRVRSFPYHALRNIGGGQARDGVRSEFAAAWHTSVLPAFAHQRGHWFHCYTSSSPAEFKAQHRIDLATYVERNVTALSQLLLSGGATPEVVLVVNWLHAHVHTLDEMSESMEHYMAGMRRVIDSREWPWQWHIGVAGAGRGPNGLLRLLADGPEPTDPVLAGRAIAQAWRDVVEGPYREVFGEVVQ